MMNDLVERDCGLREALEERATKNADKHCVLLFIRETNIVVGGFRQLVDLSSKTGMAVGDKDELGLVSRLPSG